MDDCDPFLRETGEESEEIPARIVRNADDIVGPADRLVLDPPLFSRSGPRLEQLVGEVVDGRDVDGVRVGAGPEKRGMEEERLFPGGADRIGSFVTVRVTERAGWTLKGEIEP